MGEGRGLLEVTRERIRTRHLALRTEQAYLQWIRRYVAYHDRAHPRNLGAPAVEAFLSHLATERKVSASTQNQALQALLFLYRHVLSIDLPWLANVTRAQRPLHLPVVLSRAEVRALLAQLDGTPWLVASLLYGDSRTWNCCPRGWPSDARGNNRGGAAHRKLVSPLWPCSDSTGNHGLSAGIWIKNLTNREYLAIGIAHGPPPDGGLGFDYSLVGEPRTYGLDLTYWF